MQLKEKSKKEIFQHFKKTGAFLNGHFLLSSGLHSPNYIQCALALKNPVMAGKIGKKLAKLWDGEKPDIVVSPAIGGIIIGHEVAKAFEVDFLFTERENGRMSLRRGFSIERGQKVLIVEDVFTTGKSTLEVYKVVKASSGIVLGALSIINRMSGKKFYFPKRSLLNLDIENYTPEKCPLCKKKIPIIKPGSRK
jgi:orotate phosphoribosyltransferase